MEENKGYKWEYNSVGGVIRVKVDSGEAIANLENLDQKKWTVLSCPVEDLDFDKKTLKLIDTDADARIHVKEVVAASKWLTSVVKDSDILLKGECELPLDAINTECEEGKRLYDSAKSILESLGVQKDTISIEDTADSEKIFNQTVFNGDGIIIPASADDEQTSDTISCCVETMGALTDRSGEKGTDAARIEAFYTALADYSAWQKAGKENKDTIFPYGDDSEAAMASCDALKAKIEDFYMRCKLIQFDGDAASAVDVSIDRISAISAKDLGECGEEISSYPIARPNAEGILPFNAVNPAWKAAFAQMKALVLDKDFAGKDGINEDEWNGILAKFGPLREWQASKKGAEVESLGIEKVEAILKADKKAALLSLVEKDASFQNEFESIEDVDKLLHYCRDFYKLLRNYVVFTDFYGRNDKVHATFEAGKLYIDERCCNLCLRVGGTGNHAEAAGLSGIFLIYCTCTSKILGKTMDIVAIMTDGGIKNLRVGKNAIFYDNEGNDWDAVVTKIVDNPISIRQAFWAPYRKFWNFCVEKINKSASDKESKLTASMESTVASAEIPTTPDAAAAAKKPQAFDIAKFAGIFAAIGMAVGFIGQALVSLATGIAALKWWQLILAIAAIILVISGPSCFIAWSKLRKRNLGPVLNANGWAINSIVPINIMFGRTLTKVARYPFVKADDPFKKKGTPAWKVILFILALLIGVGAALYFTGKLAFLGL